MQFFCATLDILVTACDLRKGGTTVLLYLGLLKEPYLYLGNNDNWQVLDEDQISSCMVAKSFDIHSAMMEKNLTLYDWSNESVATSSDISVPHITLRYTSVARTRVTNIYMCREGVVEPGPICRLQYTLLSNRHFSNDARSWKYSCEFKLNHIKYGSYPRIWLINMQELDVYCYNIWFVYLKLFIISWVLNTDLCELLMLTVCDFLFLIPVSTHYSLYFHHTHFIKFLLFRLKSHTVTFCKVLSTYICIPAYPWQLTA